MHYSGIPVFFVDRLAVAPCDHTADERIRCAVGVHLVDGKAVHRAILLPGGAAQKAGVFLLDCCAWHLFLYFSCFYPVVSVSIATVRAKKWFIA